MDYKAVYKNGKIQKKKTYKEANSSNLTSGWEKLQQSQGKYVVELTIINNCNCVYQQLCI